MEHEAKIPLMLFREVSNSQRTMIQSHHRVVRGSSAYMGVHWPSPPLIKKEEVFLSRGEGTTIVLLVYSHLSVITFSLLSVTTVAFQLWQTVINVVSDTVPLSRLFSSCCVPSVWWTFDRLHFSFWSLPKNVLIRKKIKTVRILENLDFYLLYRLNL